MNWGLRYIPSGRRPVREALARAVFKAAFFIQRWAHRWTRVACSLHRFGNRLAGLNPGPGVVAK